MQLQQKILKSFKSNYPEMSYGQIAQMTGIQKTRVFRIFNGSELKVSELEALERLNQKADAASTFEFIETAKQCLSTLNQKILNKLLQEMQYTLNSAKLSH